MTPYRSASAGTRRRCVLLCAACGARIGFEGQEVECRCPRCGEVQATARPESGFEVPVLVYLSDDGRPYEELREFSRSLGQDRPALAIDVRVDGVVHVVSLSLNSGSADGLELTAKVEGLPPMRLTREGPTEREAKERGISREVQIGDPEFDHVVYIDSDASDEDVQTVFSSPAVRAAARKLLQAFFTVKIDVATIEATGNGDKPDCYGADYVRTHLAAMRMLAGAPRRSTLELQPPAPGGWLQAFSWSLSPMALVWLIIAGIQWGPFDSARLVVPGIGLGLMSWLLLRVALRRRLSGRSGSHTRIIIASAMTFFSVPMTCIAALFTLNAAFDPSAERVQSGEVRSTSWNDESNETTAAVRGDDLDVSCSVSDPGREVKSGDMVTVWSKKGALGAKWATRHCVIVHGGRRFTGD